MSYDEKCHDLAAVFLRDYWFPNFTDADTPVMKDALAQDIQDAIDAAIEYYGLREKE